MRPMNAVCPILLTAILSFATCVSAKEVEIRVEGGNSRQLYEGFGQRPSASSSQAILAIRLVRNCGPKCSMHSMGRSS